MRPFLLLIGALVGGSLVVAVQAADITGAGSTFAAPLYFRWAAEYQKAGGGKVLYHGVGSSDGLKQILAKEIDFAGSDAPLTDDELTKDGLLQFPTAVGGVVPVVNLPGIKAGELTLSGPLLGDIFLGKIRSWNHPAIQAINHGLKLPDMPITVSAERRGECIAVSVADRGIGIDSSEQSLIFERFYRARNHNEGTAGTGMGLAISRSIIEAHGGHIDVTSQPGQGSVFTFTMPAASAAR